MALRLVRRDPLALEIQRALDEDLARGARLMLPEYRRAAIVHRSFEGYCAAAAGAYFFLGGGLEAGLQPTQLTHSDGSHWWIVKHERLVIDLTLRPREDPGDFPYEEGHPRGFMQTGYRRPSKRAQQLIQRVIAARED